MYVKHYILEQKQNIQIREKTKVIARCRRDELATRVLEGHHVAEDSTRKTDLEPAYLVLVRPLPTHTTLRLQKQNTEAFTQP